MRKGHGYMSDEENMQPSCCQPEQPLEADDGAGCHEPEECCSSEPTAVKDESEGERSRRLSSFRMRCCAFSSK